MSKEKALFAYLNERKLNKERKGQKASKRKDKRRKEKNKKRKKEKESYGVLRGPMISTLTRSIRLAKVRTTMPAGRLLRRTFQSLRTAAVQRRNSSGCC